MGQTELQRPSQEDLMSEEVLVDGGYKYQDWRIKKSDIYIPKADQCVREQEEMSNYSLLFILFFLFIFKAKESRGK